MIYDSEAQKAFILEAIKKYPTNYETALNLANSFGMAIQNGQIVDPKKQLEAFPPDGPASKMPEPPAGANGNRKERRAKAKTEKRVN